jgi:biopolymer transport protein ExbB
MDIQERLTAFAMLGATWVMWLLVGLSILGLAIILDRAYFFVATRDDIARLKAALLAKLRTGDVEGVRTAMTASKSVEAQIVLATLGNIDDGPDSAEQRMEAETTLRKLDMERNLAFLGTVGNNAPFVGLAGTVIGIVRAFAELEQTQGQVSAGLMAQIGEALVATLIGLLVALPAVAFFNFFQRLIKARMVRGEAMGREVLAYLRSNRYEPSTAAASVAVKSEAAPAKAEKRKGAAAKSDDEAAES